MLNNQRILDADTHVNEPADLWEKHMPAKYGDRIPRVVDTPFGQAWQIEGRSLPITNLINVTGISPVHWQPIAPEGYRGMRPGGRPRCSPG